MRVIQQSQQQIVDLNTFNPLCKVQQSLDGQLYVKMMLHQNTTQYQQPTGHMQEQVNDHPTLKKYIDGWLEFKEKKKVKGSKYEKYWFVLKGQLLGGGQLTSAFLFCFKDNMTHEKSKFIGSTQIDIIDHSVELHKIEGNEQKPWKCEFSVKVNGKTKLQFRSQDNIERDRWIYALVDLVGQQLPPSELPNLNNGIRPSPRIKLGSSMRKLPRELKDAMVVNDPMVINRIHGRASMPNISTPPNIASSITPPVSPRTSNENDYATRFPTAAQAQQPLYRGTRVAHMSLDSGVMNRSRDIPLQQSPQNITLNGRRIGEVLDSRRATIATPSRVSLLAESRSTFKTSLGNCPFYYGPMSRSEAENELKSQQIGSYLLRDCQSKRGCFTLTFKDKEKIKNHMIEPQAGSNKFQFNGPEFTRMFTSPDEGVIYYMDMKRNRNFNPIPYIKRLPGDGQEEDNSYIESEEINPTTDILKTKKDFRPPMMKSPSLPEQYHPPAQLKNGRRVSAIERPTYERRLTSQSSLDDHYVETDCLPVFSPTKKSLPAEPQMNDDSYILGSELGLDSADPKNNTESPKVPTYANSPASPNGEVNRNKRKTSGYNAPLPPTPEKPEFTLGSVPDTPQEDDNGYIVTDSPAVFSDSPAGYVVMDSGDKDLPPSPETKQYNAPLPPSPLPPHKSMASPTAPMTSQTTTATLDDNGYVETDAPSDTYLEMDELPITAEVEGYLKMDEHNDTEKYVKYVDMNGATDCPDHPQYQHPRKALPLPPAGQDLQQGAPMKRGSMVVPRNPKINIKKKAGSMQVRPTFQKQANLPRQSSVTLIPSAPASKIKESNDLLKQLNLAPIPPTNDQYNKHLNNNNNIGNDGPTPVPPPRQAKPQRLPNQSSIHG
uniref:PH domain-containing protein n=1 Tax=Clytia hemisphaerica TaxID=252671 RepID=A0A7M6DPP7_9CNID